MISVITGLIAGTVHVVTGPDHLTAIAPIAVRHPVRAWVSGMRWGLGHSAGVAAVGLLSLWLRDLLPVEWLSSWGERLVGVMLIGIGLWALRKALKNTVHAHVHEHSGEKHVHFHTHQHPRQHEQPQAHVHTHAAFGIGILHGLAGSSHFLGVLPILAFPTKTEAVTYLAAFGVGTVIAMAVFSWGVGRIARRYSVNNLRVYRGLMSTSAVAAVGVGFFWLCTSF